MHGGRGARVGSALVAVACSMSSGLLGGAAAARGHVRRPRGRPGPASIGLQVVAQSPCRPLAAVLVWLKAPWNWILQLDQGCIKKQLKQARGRGCRLLWGRGRVGAAGDACVGLGRGGGMRLLVCHTDTGGGRKTSKQCKTTTTNHLVHMVGVVHQLCSAAQLESRGPCHIPEGCLRGCCAGQEGVSSG